MNTYLPRITTFGGSDRSFETIISMWTSGYNSRMCPDKIDCSPISSKRDNSNNCVLSTRL